MPRGSRQIGFLCAGLLVLAMGPIARTLAVQTPAQANAAPLPPIAGCVSMNGWNAEWQPTFAGPDYTVADSFQCNGYRLHVMLVQYTQQHQGKEAVGELNTVIPRNWWNLTMRDQRKPTETLQVDEYRVERGPRQLTIWNWYAVDAQPTASEFATKALEALNALRLRSGTTTNFTVAVEADSAVDAESILDVESARLWAWFTTERARA